MKLAILSGGAAQGLVSALADTLRTRHGIAVDGTFGAVGAMKEKLLAGAPADVVILTRALIDELAANGHVVAHTVSDLGRVRTGVAVKPGRTPVDVGSAAALRALLRAADGIHFPDPQRATAGIHFAKVLDALGIRAEVMDRLHTYPNGGTAMRALAASPHPAGVGVTQITEILHTPGVVLVGPLPPEFELATVYTAAMTTRSTSPSAAHALVALLGGAESVDARRRAGFEI
jgi:molybdate transport system substrate-binding protein